MKELIYYCDYENKEFMGYVINGAGNTVFEIGDTDIMRDLIESGDMEHIDDVKGLEVLLKHEGDIEEDDTIEFGGLFLK